MKIQYSAIGVLQAITNDEADEVIQDFFWTNK